MKLAKLFLVICCIFGLTVFLSEKQIYAVVCPLATDTKVSRNPGTKLCFSGHDPLSYPGFGTLGGGLSTCVSGKNQIGQVTCPGYVPTVKLPAGNTCVVQITAGLCFAGHGPSGFNTPGCTPSTTTP